MGSPEREQRQNGGNGGKASGKGQQANQDKKQKTAKKLKDGTELCRAYNLFSCKKPNCRLAHKCSAVVGQHACGKDHPARHHAWYAGKQG